MRAYLKFSTKDLQSVSCRQTEEKGTESINSLSRNGNSIMPSFCMKLWCMIFS